MLMKPFQFYAIIVAIWLSRSTTASCIIGGPLLLQCSAGDLYQPSTLQCSCHRGVFDDLPLNVDSGRNEPLGDYRPWSYAPVCTELVAGFDERLCVYTNASFSNGRGISIVSTPDLAEAASQLSAFQDPQAFATKQVNQPQDAWHARELPGRGIGAIANRKLSRGDRLTAYTPALLIHRDIFAELSTREREKYIRLALDQLPPAIRNACYSLATVSGMPEYIGQDVLKTNNFDIPIAGHPHIALIPEPSRLNHDCGPNAQYVIDPESLTHVVHATRDIEPGEEITITYTPPVEPTRTRQQRLHDGFRFTCTCARSKASTVSDHIVEEIRQIENTLNEWSSSTPAVKLATRMIQLHLDEGLEGFLDLPYGHLALAHNSVGDALLATEYAKAAIEAIQLKDGDWTSNLQMWEDLKANPRNHWSWRYRND